MDHIEEVHMAESFSIGSLDGQVFLLEGRFTPEMKEKIAKFIRDNGGSLAMKFGPSVTAVLQDRLGKSKHPEELVRTFEYLTDLLGLRQCNPAKLFEDEDARRRIEHMPSFALPSGFELEVRDGAWSGKTFGGDANADGNIPWRLVNCSFIDCQFEHLTIIGSLAGTHARVCIEGGRMADCLVRHCRFANVEQWSAERVVFEDSSVNSFSGCNLAELRWLRGTLGWIIDSTARSLFICEGEFPSIRRTEFSNCQFERLGPDKSMGSGGGFLRRKVVKGGSLHDCSLAQVRLDQFCWEGVTLSGVTFENCEFQELVFTGCHLAGCRFKDVAAGTLDFVGCTLEKCLWEGASPKTLGLPVGVSAGIEGLGTDASDGSDSESGFTVLNIGAMPALAAFCEMFVARDNVKLDFVASTADGRPVDVHFSKLTYWEFSATGASVAFKTQLGGLEDKSPAGIARLLARLFREVGITSVASKGMKVKMTALCLKTPVIPAAEFKKLALAAFNELTGAD